MSPPLSRRLTSQLVPRGPVATVANWSVLEYRTQVPASASLSASTHPFSQHLTSQLVASPFRAICKANSQVLSRPAPLLFPKSHVGQLVIRSPKANAQPTAGPANTDPLRAPGYTGAPDGEVYNQQI
jgi:hypothetical protein